MSHSESVYRVFQSDSKSRQLAHECTTCSFVRECGGLYTTSTLLGCQQHCRCTPADRNQCQRACICNHKKLVDRIREIHRFDLDLPRIEPKQLGNFPLLIPVIQAGYLRHAECSSEVIGLKMQSLFRLGNGAPLNITRHDLARKFRIRADAKLFVTSIDIDQVLENLWKSPSRKTIFEWIASLDPECVTVPNFSLFCDAVRTEDLYNMKRIAILWHEMESAGIKTAIHLNARTDNDWDRWIGFLKAHPEIRAVAFEFNTVSNKARRTWYLEKLLKMKQNVDRPLRLLVQGGREFLPRLRAAFESTSTFSTDAYINMVKRKKLAIEGLKLKKRNYSCGTPSDFDHLLDSNISTEATLLQSKYESA